MHTIDWECFCGGELKNLVVSRERADTLKSLSLNLTDIQLGEHQMCDLELLATGAYSPLSGFMVRSDYEAVLDRMQLQDGTLWPLPVCLDITQLQARQIEPGQSIALRDPEGFLLAVMHVEDMWPIDKEKHASAVFNTTEPTHPGVQWLQQSVGEVFLGGSLEVINLPLHYNFKQLRMTPAEVLQAYQKLGWQRVVGVQTHSVLHRAQFEMTLEAMRLAKGNLIILAGVGIRYTEDVDYYTRVRCYKAIAHHYPPENVIISLLPYYAQPAGVRTTILNSIVAKNYGCTHFALAPKATHATKDDPSAASGEGRELKPISHRLENEVGIQVIQCDEVVYLPFEDEHRPMGQVSGDVEFIHMTGADIQKRVRRGRRIPKWASFPDVIRELRKAYPPPKKQGFTIFFTGLSGAGKSTIAKVLYSKMLEIGERPVSLLDGDIVRRNLSSELTFSKEHRDINVRRIGFVAMEITKNRGIAICATIAPYETTRLEIRQAIEAYGGFIEVHVATPLEECEKRDRKGMYAKARAGLIKGYTGIDDPYEDPQSPELRIDTSSITPDEGAQEVLLFLGQKGFI